MRNNAFSKGFLFLESAVFLLFGGYFAFLFFFHLPNEWFTKTRCQNKAYIFYFDDGKTAIGHFSENTSAASLHHYFLKAAEEDLISILSETNKDGAFKYRKTDGQLWNPCTDSLKIFTSINSRMQTHAEKAVKISLANLQPVFSEDLKLSPNYPFSKNINPQLISTILSSAKTNSKRYKSLIKQGYSKKEIDNLFDQKTSMSVFSWKGEIDTTLSPNDSIRYYKSFLQAGLIALDPKTGFVKAWVGGADANHFPKDHVRQTQRQVGSLIKPFVYATALKMEVVDPLETFSGHYCVGDWCPAEKVAGDLSSSLISDFGPGFPAVAVLSKMGKENGPGNIAQLLKNLNIPLEQRDITLPMVLGTMSISLEKITGAYGAIANEGKFNRPKTILRIEDKHGHVIYTTQPKSKEVFSANFAYYLVSVLKENVKQGQSAKLTRNFPYGNITAPTAGKPGFSQSNSDFWFVGMTPNLVTGVWMGAEDRAVRFSSRYKASVLPIYGYFMNFLYHDSVLHFPKRDFTMPKSFSVEWTKNLNPIEKPIKKQNAYF